MQVTLDIPDTLAAHISASGREPSRAALETILVDAYRARLMHESEIKHLLGFETRMQVHALLKQHNVPLDYDVEDLEQDMATLRSLREPKAHVPA